MPDSIVNGSSIRKMESLGPDRDVVGEREICLPVTALGRQQESPA